MEAEGNWLAWEQHSIRFNRQQLDKYLQPHWSNTDLKHHLLNTVGVQPGEYELRPVAHLDLNGVIPRSSSWRPGYEIRFENKTLAGAFALSI